MIFEGAVRLCHFLGSEENDHNPHYYSDNEIYKFIYRVTNGFECNDVCRFMEGFNDKVLKSKSWRHNLHADRIIEIIKQGKCEHIEGDYFFDIASINNAKFIISEIKRSYLLPAGERLNLYKLYLKAYKLLNDYRLEAFFWRAHERGEEYDDYFPRRATFVADAIELWEQEVEPFMRIYSHTEESEENPSRKGAPNKGKTDIRNCIFEKDKSLIERLKRLTLGKRGKDFYLYIGVCINHRLMCKPTFKQIEAEFGNVGSRAGYDEYIRDYKTKYTDEEKAAVWEAISAEN